MTQFLAAASKFVRDEEGATMVEYGLMLALIAVIAMGAVKLVGQNASGTFNNVANSLSTAS